MRDKSSLIGCCFLVSSTISAWMDDKWWVINPRHLIIVLSDPFKLPESKYQIIKVLTSNGPAHVFFDLLLKRSTLVSDDTDISNELKTMTK